MCLGLSNGMRSQQKRFHVSLKMVEEAEEFVGQHKESYSVDSSEKNQTKKTILLSFNEDFTFHYGLSYVKYNTKQSIRIRGYMV